MLTNSEIMRSARAKLKGNWGEPIGITLLFLAISYAVILPFMVGEINMILIDPTFANKLFSKYDLYSWIVSIPLGGALMFGLYRYFLRFVEDKKRSVSTLFKAFKKWDSFLKCLVVYLIMSLIVLAGCAFFVIPGIIAGLGLSQVFFILSDNPKMEAGEVIKRSWNMMKGYKWKFFVLGLMFMGWILLSILTFGILLIWVTPHIYTSYALFYTEIRREYEAKLAE